MKKHTKNFLAYAVFIFAALGLTFAIVAGKRCNVLAQQQRDQLHSAKGMASLYRYAEQLQHSKDPRDMAAAAFFLSSNAIRKNDGDPAAKQHIALLKTAIALSPNDKDLAWLEAINCGQLHAACQKEAALERLKKLEPENLLVHLMVFNAANTAKDELAQAQAFNAMANSRYSDTHIHSLGQFYYTSLRNWQPYIPYKASELFAGSSDQTPITHDEARKITALGYSIALAMPALQDLSSFCKNPGITQEQLLSCQKIARVAVTDRSAVMHFIGLRLGLRVYREEPEAYEWREAYRQYLWQTSKQQYGESERQILKLWPQSDERSMQEARLKALNVSLIPPQDWLPDSKEARALLAIPASKS